MNTIDDHQQNAIHNFLIEVTLPIIAVEKDEFVIIGTGTLFTIAGRLFLVSAAHILDHFEPGRWGFPTGPHAGEIKTFGQAAFFRASDPSIDVCVAEILDSQAKADLENAWRVLTLRDVWLPDYSADVVYLTGYPSIRAKYEKGNLRGQLFVVPTQFRKDAPQIARLSDDEVRKGIDFFLDYKKAINELTGEDVSAFKIQGTSGSSIWAYRKRGWRDGPVWSPQTSMCVIGIQSAYVHNDYLRCKSWGPVLIALAQVDKKIRAEVELVIEKIRISIGP